LSPGADSVEELRAHVGRLAAAEPDEVARAIPETLGAWLGAHTRSAEVRQAILLMAAVVFHSHPEEASAGRFMQFLQRRAADGASRRPRRLAGRSPAAAGRARHRAPR